MVVEHTLFDRGSANERFEVPYLVGSAEIDRVRGAALFAYSGDAIVDLDLAGVIAGFNPAAERLFGYRASDLDRRVSHWPPLAWGTGWGCPAWVRR